MIITRNIDGKEVNIELTNEEIERAYRYQDLEYHKQDVAMKYYDMNDEDCPYSDSDLEYIVNEAMDIMSNFDSYWDCYWNCFDGAIKNFEYELKHNSEI